MLTQAASVTLRVLLFRAGPQDFPYAPSLTRLLVPLALAANFALLSLAVPGLVAAIMAGTMVLGLAVLTRFVLRLRSMESRYTQTFHTLLATSTALTLLLIPAMAQIAPELRQLAENPQLLQQSPPAVRLPTGPVLAINVLNIWNFAVTAHIFRHATGVRLLAGGLIALAVSATLLMFVLFSSSLLAALFGAGQ